MSNYVTAIGLDVHARSISACAFDPMTGEVSRARFGYDPASVAEWALGFESPKAVYESGPTGFHLCRALRALGVDRAVGAVSRCTGRPPDRGRRTTGATPSGWPGSSPAATSSRCGCPTSAPGRPRPLPRPGGRPRRPAARQAAHVQVPSQARPGVRRGDAGRAPQVELDRGPYWRWARSIPSFDEADDAAAYEHYTDAVDRCGGPEGARAQGGRYPPRAPSGRPTVDALCLVKGVDVATAFLLAAEDGRLLEVPERAVVRRVVRARALGALERRDRVPRRDHPRGELPRGGARSSRRRGTCRCRRAPQEAGPSHGSRRRRAEQDAAKVQPPPAGQARRHVAGGKEPCAANCATAREMACWVWAIALMVGSARGEIEPTPGARRAPRPLGAIPVPFSGSGDRHARHETAMKPEAPAVATKCGSDPRILERRTRVEQTRLKRRVPRVKIGRPRPRGSSPGRGRFAT